MRLRSVVLVSGALIAGAAAIVWAVRRQAEGPSTGGSAGTALPAGGVRFTDVAEASGIDFVHETGARGKRYMPETTIGGAGWIDYDADGLYDLYLVNGNIHADRGGEGDTPSRLYRNQGNGRFTDVTAEAGVGNRGYGSGLAVGDYDNDGLSDLYVTNLGPNVLYHNEGGGRFRDVTKDASTAGGGWSTSAAFLDYDQDGLLDLYVCRYVEYDPSRECKQGGIPSHCSPHEFPGMPDILYRNRGNGTFEDVSQEAGVAVAGPFQGKSLGVVVLDHDDDGDQDIYVACDQVPNLLFRNNGDGTFTEAGLIANVAYSSEGVAQAGMGVDAGDVDLDGREDIVVTNFADEPDTLYRNDGGGLFSDATKAFDLAGPTLVPLAFGILLFDPDLDGDLDLYIANGHVQDNVAQLRQGMTFAQRDLYLENLDGRRFADASARSGAWFERPAVKRAAAAADYDEDGDEDVAVLVSGGRPALLRNDGPPGHWIAFRLEGTRSNRDGYGAKVTVTARSPRGSLTRILTCRSARSYLAACDPRVRVGLQRGDVAVDRVEVRWPSGTLQTIESPAVNRVHRIKEP
jgi:hypothetical protein